MVTVVVRLPGFLGSPLWGWAAPAWGLQVAEVITGISLWFPNFLISQVLLLSFLTSFVSPFNSCVSPKFVNEMFSV